MRRLVDSLPVLLLGLAMALPARGLGEGTPQDGSPLLRVEVEFHHLPAGNEPLNLAHGYIEPGSLTVMLGDSLLVDGRDVWLRGRSGVLVPLRDWADLNPASCRGGPGCPLIISYRFIPVAVPPRLDLRPVGAGPDRKSSGISPGSTPPALKDEPGQGQLTVRGSKSVQVSSGSRRDMVVDQNLRLDISGPLTPDISVRAFLSDDNLPVVPEGNTQQLRDIDKVLVQLKGPQWSSTLGDFVAQRRGTAFGNYRRKLQGVSLQGKSGVVNYEVLAGSPRGRYRTLQIKGQESNQGPYFLGGGDSAANIFIVAGSEHVTVDGVPLVRGSDRDYVIDYVRGTVTFTYKLLITSESSIVVEFEEGEGPYGRTVTGAGAGWEFSLPGDGGAGRFQMRVLSEKDDPTRLRTGELGPADEAILAAAGDNPQLAIAPGVTAVADSTGSYDLVTTGGQPHYIQASGAGAWNVSFYYAGPGRGDYDLDTLGTAGERLYVFRGPNLGSYAVGRPLELPEAQSMVNLVAALGDTSGTHVNAEWDVSRQDLNRLSDLGDGDNHGGAVHVQAGMGKQPLRLRGRSLGKVSVGGEFSDLTATFRPFELTRDIFFYRTWGLDDRARRPGFLDEADRQWTLNGNWETGGDRRRLGVKVVRGGLDHGGSITASRQSWQGNWRWGGLAGNHTLNRSTATDARDPLAIVSTLRRHTVGWQWGWLRPEVQYGFDRWADAAENSQRADGYRRRQLGLSLDGKNGRALTWRISFNRDLADSLRADTWSRERDGRTSRLNLATGSLAGMRLVGEGTVRRILKPDLPDQTTRLGQATLSGNWEKSATDFSLGYRVDNSRTEVLDRQIVFVGDRQGSYDQDGQFLGQNLGAYDMILAGTDSLVATTAVKADLNWRQGFGFLGRERWYGAWSVFTLASVECRSTTSDIGRLLALDPHLILADSTTVLGDVNVSQELTLLQNHPSVDLRGKFEFRQTRDRQFSSHPEDRLQRNYQVRGSVRTGRVSSWQWTLQSKVDQRTSTEDVLSVRRSFRVVTRSSEFGWTYNPNSGFRLTLQGEFQDRRDAVTGIVQQEAAGHPSLRHRLAKAWTLQGDARVGNITSKEPAGTLRPWFFPAGGVKVDASFRLSWQRSQFLSFAASWFARKEGGRRWQHDVRLESTARF